MRKAFQETLYAVFMGMVLPGLILALLVMVWEKKPEEETPETEARREGAALSALVRWEDGDPEEMDMDTYLTGVVLAEMPAWFETEALKAQAVAARTYAWKAHLSGGKHGDGSVCTDYTCCQAYLSPEDYLKRGGTEEDMEKIRQAVLATSGMVLTYEGKPIEAVFFSCSGGRTEDALAVWGTDYPYLRSVDSPGEEEAPVYTDTKTFSAEEFQEALGTALSGEPETWLGQVSYTSGGGVDTMELGGKTYKGTELRAALGLRSTAFTLSIQGDTITIETHGWGHRVGMSQYGADAMAAAGSSFREILEHYYTGAQVRQLY